MKIRFVFALWASKFTLFVMKLCKKNASNFPGVVALKLCPDYLSYVHKSKLLIEVTGTNGKTTTANLISDLLVASGKKVATNRAGANINTGVATTLTSSVNIFNRPKVDAVVIEADERFSRFVTPFIKPDYLVVTNLFRDSLKRNAHSEYIRGIIDNSLPENTKLILNADELCSGSIGEGHERHYFGMGPLPEDKKEPENLIMDYSICPKCNTKLVYDSLKYHHIGIAHCPACDYKSTEPEYKLISVDEKTNTMLVDVKGEQKEFFAISTILFNMYNEMAAIALLYEIGYSYEEICGMLKNQKVVDSRLNRTPVGDIELVMAMAKGQSAVSTSRTFDYIKGEPEDKAILMFLDDYYDRKNSVEFIGWIYDVDFEYLNQPSVKQIIIAGPRYLDYRVRLRMAGLEEPKAITCYDEDESLKLIDFDKVKSVYILYDTSTYHLAVEAKKKLTEMLEKRV